MLELAQVSVRFAEKVILSDFSFSFRDRETTCLIGPSGCGKTTLLRTASGLLKPDSGRVSIPGGRRSFLFQEDRLLPWRCARANLTALGADAGAAEKALRSVGLQNELDAMPSALSGGMRRRVAIARALALGGDLFFLDEPLRGLDEPTAEPVLRALREAVCGKTALLITHRPEEALALSDRVVLLGGPPVKVLREEKTGAFDGVEPLKEWIAWGCR